MEAIEKKYTKLKEGFYNDIVIKPIFLSSDGTIVFSTKQNELIIINADKAKKIVGVEDYLSCYISNNWRMYIHSKVRIYDDVIHIKLIDDNVEFIVSEEDLPNFFIDKMENSKQ